MKSLLARYVIISGVALTFSVEAGQYTAEDGKIWNFDPKTGHYFHSTHNKTGGTVMEMKAYGKTKKLNESQSQLDIFLRYKLKKDDETVDYHCKKMLPLEGKMEITSSSRRFLTEEKTDDEFNRVLALSLNLEKKYVSEDCLMKSPNKTSREKPGAGDVLLFFSIEDDYYEKTTVERRILRVGLACTAVDLVEGPPRCFSFSFSRRQDSRMHLCKKGKMVQHETIICRKSAPSDTPQVIRRVLREREIELDPQPLALYSSPTRSGCPANPNIGGLGAIGRNHTCPKFLL